jgi:hypothetical protein
MSTINANANSANANNTNANNGGASNGNGNDGNGDGNQTVGAPVPNRAPLMWHLLVFDALVASRNQKPVLWQFPNLLQSQGPHRAQTLIAMRLCDPWWGSPWHLRRFAAIPSISGPLGFDPFLRQIRGGVHDAVPITIEQAWRLSRAKRGLDYTLVEPDAALLTERLSANTAAQADDRDLNEHYFPSIIAWLRPAQ